MKIGITCSPTYGGSGAVATELGLELAERGHEVHFISYAQPFRLDRFRERVFFHEVEMDQYPLFEHPPYSLALAVAIHDTALNQDLDLVHVHYAIPHATSAWIAEEMLSQERELKIVTTLHGTDITLVGLHPSFQAITQFSILKSHGLTSVSEFLKDRTVADFNVPQERIRVIPNFIDPQTFRRDKKPCHRATLAPDGEKILMHISNFRPVKRIGDVVEVFARISREIPAAWFWWGMDLRGPGLWSGRRSWEFSTVSSSLGSINLWMSFLPAPTSFSFQARTNLLDWRRWKHWHVERR